MRKCMVIGSFDPVTVGHAELIRRAAELFDRTYAVIMHNSEKQYLFSGEQRLRLLELACGGIYGASADIYEGYAADYAREQKIDCIVRGIRGEADVAYELEMARFNRARYPDAQTIFLPAYGDMASVSSTHVRELLAAGIALAVAVRVRMLDHGLAAEHGGRAAIHIALAELGGAEPLFGGEGCRAALHAGDRRRAFEIIGVRGNDFDFVARAALRASDKSAHESFIGFVAADLAGAVAAGHGERLRPIGITEAADKTADILFFRRGSVIEVHRAGVVAVRERQGVAAAADKTAFVFMGHGTSHTAKVSYSQMQTTMQSLGYDNVFIGTVEGEPEETSCETVIEAVKAAGYTKVILRPLMVVAGDHANNDMAGEDADSWLSQFTAAGCFEDVDCQISGLGRIADVQQLYIAHTKAAMDLLNG